MLLIIDTVVTVARKHNIFFVIASNRVFPESRLVAFFDAGFISSTSA